MPWPQKEKPFVNAVLRQLLRRRQEVMAAISRSENPGLKFAISARLLTSLRQISAATEADLEYLDHEPAFHLRFNPGQMTLEQARQTLAAAGIPCRELPQLDCFETTAAGQVLENPEQLSGFYVQNTGSQAVALLAAATAEENRLRRGGGSGGQIIDPGLPAARPENLGQRHQPAAAAPARAKHPPLAAGYDLPFRCRYLPLSSGPGDGRPGHHRRSLHLERHPAQKSRFKKQDQR